MNSKTPTSLQVFVPPDMRRVHQIRRLKEGISSLGLLAVQFLVGRRIDRSHYSVVIPEATYSPWLADQSFRRISRKLKHHTIVDPYRLYELWQLTSQLGNVEGDIIEVGVWKGGSGCLIASRSQQVSTSATTVYLCDTFQGVVKSGEHDTFFRGGEYGGTSPADIEQLALSLGLNNVRIIKRVFPDETAHQVTASKIKLCHIDVDTYQSAKDVAEWVWPRLVLGGVIVYDDFGDVTTPGVARFVESQYGTPDRVAIHNLNGHALVVKIRNR